MTSLIACPSCEGFLPPAAAACPHCDTPSAARSSAPASPFLARLGRGLLGIAGGSTIALTLMACYGAPPCDPDSDRDGDGYGSDFCGLGYDCDDEDPNIHPGADDPEGDEIDQNCDGVDGIASNDDAGEPDDGGELDDAGALDGL